MLIHSYCENYSRDPAGAQRQEDINQSSPKGKQKTQMKTKTVKYDH